MNSVIMQGMITFVMWTSNCPTTVFYNTTDKPITVRDLREMHAASGRCKVKYPKSPCMKEFIKKDYLTYNVICGNFDREWWEL